MIWALNLAVVFLLLTVWIAVSAWNALARAEIRNLELEVKLEEIDARRLALEKAVLRGKDVAALLTVDGAGRDAKAGALRRLLEIEPEGER